ncbi:Hypothetical protein CINCED_3A024106 [Cinara cedri]|uniref:Uncharacterized protein n=1 Tax=Cinara cedri TaxID=506608 RepID=A0A5E4N9L6_9HEMI|nr:Hypothetical protein CINCED_3A024106 [Cinara cedri]
MENRNKKKPQRHYAANVITARTERAHAIAVRGHRRRRDNGTRPGHPPPSREADRPAGRGLSAGDDDDGCRTSGFWKKTAAVAVVVEAAAAAAAAAGGPCPYDSSSVLARHGLSLVQDADAAGL